jgi:hypothetical protein
LLAAHLFLGTLACDAHETVPIVAPAPLRRLQSAVTYTTKVYLSGSQYPLASATVNTTAFGVATVTLSDTYAVRLHCWALRP